MSEDEGELFLETPLNLTAPVPSHSELEPGMQISLNEKVGVVEEIGSARCIGGEGQIPFVVEIGETYPYVDGSAADGSFSFGLEYDAGTGQPTAFIGQILTPREAPSRPEDRERPVGKTALEIRCPSCGKPYEGPKLESTEMVVCSACGAGLELDEAEAKVVGQNIGTEPRFTFKIGTPLTLEGNRYEVMGRLLYDEVEEGRTYVSLEYILYNQEVGYLWLSEEDGHFTISRPSHVRFSLPPVQIPKTRIKVGKETFQLYEGGVVTLRWVDGALPWRAAVGEQTQYAHLIKPPDYAEREKTGKEMELFQGRYVGLEEMQKAVPPGILLPRPRGIYSCQPYVASPWLKGLTWVGAVFVALNLLLLMYSFVAGK
ncbi:MAG: DUF4178 domain-containing protein, partial [Deltaproteobacteria bacterium]|nr:DUF4178 domain-containing protein [Deltaproteobacteria bacterium]